MMSRTRSTGTARTSAKARLTSAAIWRISMSGRFISVNHALSVSPNSDEYGNNPCIETVMQIANEI